MGKRKGREKNRCTQDCQGVGRGGLVTIGERMVGVTLLKKVTVEQTWW